MAKRVKVDGYAGVYYRVGKRTGGRGIEKVYYVVFKKNGTVIEAKAGCQYRDNMTPAKAGRYRAALIEGREQTPQEKRDAKKAAITLEASKWTVGRLWKEYKKSRKVGNSLSIDVSRYGKYLESDFADQEPKNIIALDVERLKRKLLKSKSPQTVKHILGLLTWIINYGVKHGLCSGLPFRIQQPKVNNLKTEDLTPEQLRRLLEVIADDPLNVAGKMMRLALYSGMRRGEMFKLKWQDIDNQRGFITLVNPKGGKDERIPMNKPTRKLLDNINKTKGSPFIFPGKRGKKRTTITKTANRIKKAAGLPDNFRPLHGLRHVYASQLASSGKVDLYTLQRLLTHKDPKLTQRYAHLRDEALKSASDLAGDIVEDIVAGQKDKKIINIKGEK